MRKKVFDWRAFISIFLFLNFAVIVLSGIILFIAPSGRVARDIGFEILGLDKDGWELIHEVFGYAMIVTVIFHLYFNWKIFVNYFRKVTQKVRKLRLRESIVAISIVVFLILSVVYSFPPASVVRNLSETAKYSWEEGTVHSCDEETSETGDHYNIGTLETEKHSYVGYGRKTISEVAKELGMTSEEALKKLESHGIKASDDTLIRTIMDETGMTAEDIVNLLKE